MIYGLYQSAAGMMVNEYRQNVLTNNLANAETVGFKREIASFAERQPAPLAGVRSGPSDDTLQGLSGGLWLGRTETDFTDGALVQTGNPLDVALEGPGFLIVEAQGRRLVTRDGRLRLDRDGHLRAATDGAAVLGPGGTPILLNPRGGQPSIDLEGRIVQDGAVAGRLGIVDFEDYRALRKVGAGRFDASVARPAAAGARVNAGYTENSGVMPIKELASMIEAARAYQLNAQMVSLQDQTIGRLINEVARV